MVDIFRMTNSQTRRINAKTQQSYTVAYHHHKNLHKLICVATLWGNEEILFAACVSLIVKARAKQGVLFTAHFQVVEQWPMCNTTGFLLHLGVGLKPTESPSLLCIVFLASSRAFFAPLQIPCSRLHFINFTFQSFRISICIYYYATQCWGSLQMTSHLYHCQKKQKQYKIRKIYFWSYILMRRGRWIQ